jgi:hypothetical protein
LRVQRFYRQLREIVRGARPPRRQDLRSDSGADVRRVSKLMPPGLR